MHVFVIPYLNLEGSFEAAGKEATERSHDGGEGGEGDAVDLERIETHCGLWRQEGSVRPEQRKQRPVIIIQPVFERGAA